MFELFIAYPPCCVVYTIVFCLVLFLDNEEMLASGTLGSPYLSETAAAQGIISMMDPKFAQHISCNELGSVGSLEYIKNVLVRNFPVVQWLETLLEA